MLTILVLSLQLILSIDATSLPIFLSAGKNHESLQKRFGSHQEYIINKYSYESIKKRTDGKIEKRSDFSLYNDGNTAYYIPITVGSPPQEFNVLFDTASEYLWIPNINCINCKKYQYFTSNKSKTYFNTTTQAILYRNVIGHWSTDNVSIGSNAVSNQTVLVADRLTDAKSARDWDGVMGFALNKPSQPENFTFFQNLIKNGLQEQMFGVRLSFSVNGSRLFGGGDLTIGGVNKSHYDGEIDWLDVAKMPAKNIKLYWTLRLTGFIAVPLATDISGVAPIITPGWALLDSSAKFIYMDTNSFNSFFLSDAFPVKITLNGTLYFIPCSETHEMPTLVFYLNEKPFSLNYMDYVITSNGECILGVAPVTTLYPNQVTWILGTPFLRRFYTAYDYKNEKIGIAIAASSAARIPTYSPRLLVSILLLFYVIF